jgi:hypothetical protein
MSIQLRLNRAQLEILDLAGTKPYTLSATVSSVLADGFGDDWAASGQLELQGIGSSSFDLRKLGATTHVAGDARLFEVAGLLDHLRTTPEVKNWPWLEKTQFDSVALRGPYRLQVADGKSPSLLATVESRVVGLDVENQYRADVADFRGQLTENGATGMVTGSIEGAPVQFEGSAAWTPKLSVGGILETRLARLASVPNWLRREIPRGVSFEQGRFHGGLTYLDGGSLDLSGDVQIARAGLNDDRATNIEGQVAVLGDRVRVVVRRATVLQSTVSGQFNLDTRTQRLAGFASTNQANLRSVGQRFGFDDLRGMGQLTVLVAGSVRNPTIEARSQGRISIRLEDRPIANLGRYELDAALRNGVWTVRRGFASGPLGTIAALGSVDLDRNLLNFKVNGSSLNLQEVDPSWRGLATLEGEVRGRLDDPQFGGFGQVFGAGTKDFQVPFASSRIVADRRQIRLEAMEAVRGSAYVSGDLGLDLRNRNLSGLLSATGLQLGDFVGEDVIGSLQSPEIRVAGTLDEPEITANVNGSGIVARDVRIDQAVSTVRVAGGEVRLEGLELTAAGGRLTGAGSYSVESGNGLFGVELRDIDLLSLQPALDVPAKLEGRLNGRANLVIENSRLGRLSAEGSLDDIALNGAGVGNGLWNISSTDDDVSGVVRVGQIDRFLELIVQNYNIDTGRFEANAVAYNLELRDFYRTMERYLPPANTYAQSQLENLSGTLTLGVRGSGLLQDPLIEVQELEVENVRVGDVALGRIGRLQPEADNADLPDQVIYQDGYVTVQDLNWVSDRGVLSLTGTYDPKGDVNAALDLQQFDLSLLEIFEPNASGYVGKIDLAVQARGSSENPTVRGSLEAQNLRVASSDPNSPGVNASIPLSIEPASVEANGLWSGGLVAKGQLFYQGLSGEIDLRAPIDLKRGANDETVLVGSLKLPPRNLADIARDTPLLDAEKTRGTLQGELSLAGTLGQPSIVGNVTASAEEIAFTGTQTALRNAVMALNWDRGRTRLTFGGDEISGGRVDGFAETVLPNVAQLLENPGLLAREQLFAREVTGELNVRQFTVQGERISDGRFQDVKVDGKVTLDGSIGNPRLAGDVALIGLDVSVPTQVPAGETTEPLAISPRLDLRVTARSANLSVATSNLRVRGSATVTGRLDAPNLNGTLTVQQGTVKLPNARIAIEPDGVMRVLFTSRPNRDPIVRVDVDLEGRTNLTAPRFDSTIERYDIFLNLRGNLLADNGLQITATSDPPDLGQDRILALLGQEQIIQGLGGGGVQGISSAVASLALPVLFDPITQSLASQFGLDYINLEYNPYEGAVVTLARSLGSGFVLSARRQLSEPQRQEPIRYDLRLTYRPRWARGVLNRFSFNVGLDQDRPWKIGVEYGFRFGNVAKDGSSKVTVISGPLSRNGGR